MARSLRLLAVLFTCSICLGTATAEASINYSTVGGAYSQNFDTLITAGTNQAWTNDSTLTGWNLLNSTGGAISTYNAGNGGSSTGSFYSFGTGTATERALGGTGSGGTYFGSPGPASGAVAGWIAVAIQNATGSLLTDVALSYDGEQWRNGGNTSAQTMVLEYGFGPSFTAVSSWTTPGGTFDFTSPVVGATAAAVDGNAAGLVTGKGGAIGGLSWANGDTLWIRWTELNDAGNDHGLAIDNFSFSARAAAGGVVPETSSLATQLVLIASVALLFGSHKLLRRNAA